MATVNRYEIYGGKFVPEQTHFIDAGDWENGHTTKSMLLMALTI